MSENDHTIDLQLPVDTEPSSTKPLLTLPAISSGPEKTNGFLPYGEDGEATSGTSSNIELSTDSKQVERASWGGKLEFIFTCIGYAVGLGNVWRFPYLAYKNGGGAFLIPYVLMLGLVGLPLFFMELSFGQFASLGPIAIWRINPLFKGLGYAAVIVSWFIGLYYNVVISHTLFFLYSSFTSQLPWATCGNSWNTKHCKEHVYTSVSEATNTSTVYTTQNNTNATLTATLSNISSWATPTEEFYNYHVLEKSDSLEDFGVPSWKLLLFLLLAWIVVGGVLIKGVSSLGKVVYFTALFPYVMLTVLLVRGLTLPGAGQGIIYYLKPDFSRLADSRVWSDAATQIFYSLSACSGGLIAMSSFNKFHNNCLRDSLIVALINCGTSIFAGFVIFAVLGFMAYEKGVEVAEVASGGPGLAFMVYPEALARMPVAPLWAVFFFIMMATLGFGSQFSIIECVYSALSDEFPRLLGGKKRNMIFRIVASVVCFLLGVPMVCKGGIYLLNLVDYSVGGFPLLFVGLFECVAINMVYGYKKFANDIKIMLGQQPNFYWKICWKYLSPLIIAVTTVFCIVQYKPPSYEEIDGSTYFYPQWAQVLGWCIALFPILMIPGWYIFQYCADGGLELLKKANKPMSNWGPAKEEHRKGTIYDPEEVLSTEDTLAVITSDDCLNPGYVSSNASILPSSKSSKKFSSRRGLEVPTPPGRVRCNTTETCV